MSKNEKSELSTNVLRTKVELDRSPYIVKFKEKTKRKNKDLDKTKILQEHIEPTMTFNKLEQITDNFTPNISSDALIATDVNDYELRTVFLHLTQKEISALKKDENVEYVQPDGVFTISDLYHAHTTFQSPELVTATTTAGVSPQAETIPWGIERVKAPICWDASKGKDITVAVLDTGVSPHPDLDGNLLTGISFVPGETWHDGNGHGTHVAGTIAARDNGSGVVGVAPSASIKPMKVLSNSGSGQWSWLMQALYQLEKNYTWIDVANMSLGGQGAPDALEDYCRYASRHCLLVAAAGNESTGVGHPAKYDSVLAVSALDNSNNLASFSNRGPEVELSAPGVGILSLRPGGGYATLSGTSMASPHVAGVAALCRGTHRYSDMDDIRNILQLTATDLGTPGRDNNFGYGLVNCPGAAFRRSVG